MQVSLANLIAAQALRAPQPATARPAPMAQATGAAAPSEVPVSRAAIPGPEEARESSGRVRLGSKIDIRV
jgi:hypothetical protein